MNEIEKNVYEAGCGCGNGGCAVDELESIILKVSS
jgi:hypothetical protein